MAILDTYSAAAAYSLRKVRTAYTGAACKVRRNGDQEELDIGFSGFNLDETALIAHTGDSTSQNLLQYSQDFNNASGYWGTSNVTISDAGATAPDGTATAELFNEGTGAGVHVMYRQITASGTLCLSVYLKAGTRQYVNIAAEFNAIAAWMTVDTTNWTANTGTAGGGSISSTAITSVGNGWYRCSMVFSGVTNPYLQLIGSDVANPSVFNPTYTGTSSTWYAWGMQVNTTSLRAYRRTTTETVDGGSGYITTWYDQVGSQNFTQTTAANQPRIVNAGVIEKMNNRPMVYLNGNNHMIYANTGIMRNKSHGHIFTIARFNASTPENRLLAITTASTASSRVLIGAGATSDKFFAAGRRLDGDTYSSTSGTAAVDESALARLTAMYNWTSSDLLLYVNGTLDVNNTAFQTDGNTSDTDSAELRLGILNFSSPFTGWVPEILIFNTDQTSNRTAIETNIDDYYIQGINESTGSPKTYIYFLD